MSYLERQKRKEIHIANKIRIVKFGLTKFYYFCTFWLNKIFIFFVRLDTSEIKLYNLIVINIAIGDVSKLQLFYFKVT